ncbi:MAG: TatD family hydrolase [Prevotellaceae bacterium]|nr:TatD family hydrolase [Prevotellaceae bacterium]
MELIDTHAHIYTPEFGADRDEMLARARAAGVVCVLAPCIDAASVEPMLALAADYSGFVRPMLGLHPTELPAAPEAALDAMEQMLMRDKSRFVAVGEVGLDFYWDASRREEQIAAFVRQAGWAVRYDLPLMIHARSAHRELVNALLPMEKNLARGGVFHCFSGSAEEAAELLQRFPRFVLGIGGVLTFRNCRLGATLAAVVPLERIVLETDAPYLAPVPHRGRRNEPAFLTHVVAKLSEVYGLPPDDVARVTTATARRIFSLS